MSISIQDGSASLLMEIDGPFAARAATLVAPANPPVRIGEEVQVTIPVVPAAQAHRARPCGKNPTPADGADFLFPSVLTLREACA